MDKVAVIIVAGGSGSRMGNTIPKQFLPLAGKPVLVHTIERFRGAVPQAEIVVVLPESETGRWKPLAAEYGLEGVAVCEGGDNRFGSVKNALETIGECDYIMVHDGVRPLVSERLILRCLATAKQYGTAVPAVVPADSFRTVRENGRTSPADRSLLRAVQTPQVFRSDILRRAYQTAFDPVFTDDASVVEHCGTEVTLCEGERGNIKITVPADIIIAGALLSAQHAGDI